MTPESGFCYKDSIGYLEVPGNIADDKRLGGFVVVSFEVFVSDSGKHPYDHPVLCCLGPFGVVMG